MSIMLIPGFAQMCKNRDILVLSIMLMPTDYGWGSSPKQGEDTSQSSPGINMINIIDIGGSFFTYSWSFFAYTSFAYSPLRPLLDALSHCKEKKLQL